MVDRKDCAIVVLVMLILAAVLVPTLTVGQDYDPWSDITDDGKIRVDDILDVALRFGSDGDPTRNVTVVNWPNSSDVSVWWGQWLSTSDIILSSGYFAKGFGQLHVLIAGSGLTTGEKITVAIYGKLWNPAHNSYYSGRAGTGEVTSASPTDTISIPVPSEEFYFYAYTDSSSTGYVYLSFYLTWA